eukprot:436792-Rhodomonas_salina.1
MTLVLAGVGAAHSEGRLLPPSLDGGNTPVSRTPNPRNETQENQHSWHRLYPPGLCFVVFQFTVYTPESCRCFRDFGEDGAGESILMAELIVIHTSGCDYTRSRAQSRPAHQLGRAGQH